MLGDAALDEALRQLRLERFDAAVRQQIGVHDDDLGTMARHLEQLVAVGEHDLFGVLRRDAHRQRRRRQRRRRLAERVELGVDARDQLARRLDVVLERRRAGVEVIGLVAAGDAFHERHALALDGVGDEHLRLVGDGREVRERVAQHARSRGRRRAALPSRSMRNFSSIGPEVADRGHRGVRLELVVIDDHRDVGEALVRHRLQRLPDLAFLQLAVAGHHDDAAAAPGVAIGARHAVGLRDAHAERAGVGGDERRADIGMAGQAVQLAQLRQQVEAELLDARSAASRAPATSWPFDEK